MLEVYIKEFVDDGMLLETEDLAEQLKEMYENSKAIDVLDFLEELAQTEIKVRGFKGQKRIVNSQGYFVGFAKYP